MKMPENIQSPSSPSTREQALQWMVCLQSGEESAADRRRFEFWALDNPTHREEFERFSEIWNNLDLIKPFIAVEIGQAEAFWYANRSARFSTIRQSLPRWGTVPIVVGALVALMVLTPWLREKVGTTENHYQTTKGEQQSLTLADGSEIMMNTDTKLSVRLSDTERMVELQQGEALFTVTHDEKRPFEVRAANGTIHDLGTQFIIYKSHEQVNVSVLEGIVEVGLKENRSILPIPRPRTVKQGQHVWFTADGRVSSVESFDPQTARAWTEGQLIFESLPLEQVLKEVGRYRSGEIRLLDQSLAEIPVSGIFNIHDLESFLQALQDTLPVRATHINPHLVIVERTMKSDQSISSRAGHRPS